MKRKGFTLVELLVVIAVIALLMGLLMPALARVRQIAHRLICGANQSGIGKSLLLYAQDHDEDFPKAGYRSTVWSTGGIIFDPFGLTAARAYGPRDPTVTASLYLTVRTAEASTKLFNCAGDEGVEEFTLDEVTESGGSLPDHVEDLTDGWDFGSEKMYYTRYPGEYNSYALHLPYDEATDLRGFPLSPTSSPDSPLLVDRNPFLDVNARTVLGDTDLLDADWVENAYSDPDKKENSVCHQREGQNVLFADGHVKYERYPNCGIRKDNIWKFWRTARLQIPEDDEYWQTGGTETEPKNNGDYGPRAEMDAYLVSEVNSGPGGEWGRP